MTAAHPTANVVAPEVASEVAPRFRARLADTVATLGSEALARDQRGGVRLRRVAALVLAGLTQLFDRGRVLVVLLPLTFDGALSWSLERGHDGYRTAAVAGLAVAAVFFAWGLLVGRSFHWSLDEYPRTTAVFLRNHPAVVGVISSAIDGFPRTPSEYRSLGAGVPDVGYQFGPYATRRTVAGKVALAASRGLRTAFIFGTTAHVGMATVSGFTRRAVRRRTLVVTVEAAVMLGAIAVAVSALLTHDLFGVAEWVRNTITDRRVLLSVTAILIVIAAVDHSVRRHRYLDEHPIDEHPIDDAV